MKSYRYLLVSGALLILAALVFGAGMSVLAQEEAPNPVGERPTFLGDFYDAWVESAHAAADTEPFIHWDAEGEIPTNCARCHSTPGYRDYLGLDGTDFGSVENPAPIGTVVNCDACHNKVTWSLTSVTFPSGAELSNLNDSSRCMVCHQGRASTVSVNAKLEELGLLEDLDTVNADLSFINIHYFAAAATLYGSEAHGGYEWADQRYQRRFDHVEGVDTCIDCHNPHTLEVQVDKCGACHDGVSDLEEVREIRMNGSLIDYDGDGDIEEGIAGEIETLQEMLYQAIQAYASEVGGTAIAYNVATHPYWFIDTDGNGEADEAESVGDNAYNAYTGHLLQAAYNYQVSKKDPGAFAHNAKYIIELLYDSIATLNAQLAEPVDMAQAHRNDPGHFDATAEAFRHWDVDGEVPATCAKCHTPGGLPSLLEHGGILNAEPSNGLACTTCHDSLEEFTLRVVNEVQMPSGATVTFGEEEPGNVCLNCHQGRESMVSVNAAINRAGVGPDEVSEALNFRNPHYFAAGATLFGAEAMGAYQFEGKEYNGRNGHSRRFDTCNDCHNEHSLEVRFEECGDCHENLDIESAEDVLLIRGDEDLLDAEPVDYDGDGDVEEPIRAEIDALHSDLLVLIQSYAADTLGTPIAYSPSAYPYWFIDTNANGEADADEANSDNRYASWSPNLLRAAYNYQWVSKDPGAFAHNSRYILQVLYDSLEAMGGADAVANYTRPEVTATEAAD